jgi:hypothetical protein
MQVQAMADHGLFGEPAYGAAADVATVCRWMGGDRLMSIVATATGALITTAKGRLVELRSDGSRSLHGTRGAYESDGGVGCGPDGTHFSRRAVGGARQIRSPGSH